MKPKLSFVAALALTALTARAAEWVNISDPFTTNLPKPGTYGPTAGVAVDRANGNVFMVVADYGMWRSADHGKTFSRVDNQTIGGRCETGWA